MSAIALLAEGTEELELITIVTLLRRAGVNVTIAGLAGAGNVNGKSNVVISADVGLSEVVDKDYDIVFVPGGGEGVKKLAKSEAVKKVLQKQESRGGIIAAVCSGPLVLKAHGIALNKKLTSYPKDKDELSKSYTYTEKKVEIDGKLITSRGPGTCIEFALSIIAEFLGKEVSTKVAHAIIYDG